ncbi:Pantothenate transporter liz1 [Grifola frondosa]|uniref:Pantothenate transporter liz1 n=1 Tax=Grifola frondosa TaxID=5627 RepID=A0A1C7LNI9_GRIFR|nr:Pantothenate transporter liz1 [Grifola frondosa]
MSHQLSLKHLQARKSAELHYDCMDVRLCDRPDPFQIPTMEVIWSVLTMVLASAKNFETLVAVRFLVGLAESTFYPAIQYVIGSWYKGDELGKRACIFHGAYNGLNGVHGLAGWKWLFIIDGVITIPIAVLGFFIMPDLPSTTKPSIFYTQAQLDLAQRRMAEIGRKPPEPFTKKKFNNGSGPSTSMIFWLKSFNTSGHTVYTIGQINTYPLGTQAVQVVTSGLSGLILAWANELNGHDNEMCVALGTLALSKRDERRAAALRAKTGGDSVSDDIILEQDADDDLKKTIVDEVSQVEQLERTAL